MPEERMIDFRGLAAAAEAAVKPDFADVVARAARRRRRRRPFGAAIVAIAVVATGGTTIALTADRSPAPVKPTPVPSVGPWRTTVPPNAAGPQPQPSYTQIRPGAYDVTAPDKPLTGIFPELRAGDLDHLYLEYRDCRAKPCRPMLAATTDRGRTWNKTPLPAGEPKFHPPTVVLVHGSLVLARAWFEPPRGVPYKPVDPVYWASLDAGATWQRADTPVVEALPPGWPVHQEENGLVAVDPATGKMARLRFPENESVGLSLIDTRPTAGIWVLGLGPRGVALKVSKDGGRTWDIRSLPHLPQPVGGVSLNPADVVTSDGGTVYAIERGKGTIRLDASGDGGHTWEARAVLDLDGPLLSVLQIDDRTVIVEGVYGTYRSTDQGRTFIRVGPSLGSRGHAMPGGFTIPTNNAEFSAWISPDGAEWTYIRRPEVP
jgi:hypothetical protein